MKWVLLLDLCIGLALKSKRFDARSGKESKTVRQGVWKDVPESPGGRSNKIWPPTDSGRKSQLAETR